MKRKRRSKSGLCIVLLTVICMLAGGILSPSLAADDQRIRDAVTDTAAYLVQTVPAPQPGSIGGEWTVIGLAGSGCQLPSGYLENYYARVAESVKEQKGILHEKKYTEYSRLILALTAIGKNPADVGGYNLLTPLGDFDKTIWQGINGPIFALLALDSGNYEIPVNKSAAVQASREGYVAEILSRQCADGGFALTGTEADPDITAMALQALAKYQDQKAVKQAIEKALACLSGLQDNQGGYASWGASNSESTAQVLMALCELGLDEQDSRFVKNGHSLADNLLTYYSKGSGFRHTQEERRSNAMATEQAFYALVNLMRVTEGQRSLYRMTENAETVSVMAKGLNLATKKGGVFTAVQEKDETMNPKEKMKRGEIAAMLYQLLGKASLI